MVERLTPTAVHTHHALERLWAKRVARQPPRDLPHPPEVATSARREPRQPRPGKAHQRPAPSFGPVSVDNRQSRLFLSTWTDGRSRRLSVPNTRRSDSDPNGLPGGHRETSHTHRKLPHLHGGSLGSLGRGPILGARRPGFFTAPSAYPHPLEQACAGRGGRGVPRDSVRGAPACAAARHHMKLISLCPHHCFRVAVFTDLKSRHHETTSEVEDFESSIWSKGRTLRWFSVRSGTKTARRVGADLRGGQGGSGPLGVRGAGVGEPQSGRGGGWRMVRERGTGFKNIVR